MKTIEKNVMGYKVVLHPSERVGFWVECPELGACYSQGKTVTKTVKNMEEAIQLHTESISLSSYSKKTK